METKRNTNLSEILFKVEQKPIYLRESSEPQKNLFGDVIHSQDDKNPKYSKISRFQAVTDIESDYVFSVVAESYKLITNAEAIKLGEQCFKSIFPNLKSEDMEVFHITYPKTKSFCHIDFTHKEGGFEPWQDDKWIPFLRVTNSYNRTKLLRFDLGFCRWICTNGMIFGEKSITFRYLHTHSEVAKTAKFETDFGELKTLEKEFIEKLHNLKRYHVPEKCMLPLVCKTFSIDADEQDISKPKRAGQLLNFKNQINSLTKLYFENLGQNGYAALNVLTDFASRPDNLYISPESMVDKLQKRSGEWADEFIKEIKDDSFMFEKYLSSYVKTAELINRLN